MTPEDLIAIIGARPNSAIVVSNPTIANAIREWLVLQGVPRDRIEKANYSTLAAAYKTPSYRRKMMISPRSTVQWTPSIDLDGLTTQDERDLMELLSSADSDRRTYADPNPTRELTQPAAIPTAIPSSIPPDLINSISCAADIVIGNRLNGIRADIQREMKIQVTSEIEKAELNLSSQSRAEVNSIATSSARFEAQRYVEENVPHVIRIQTPTFNRVLAIEPRHSSFNSILRLLLVGENVYIVGPAGTGKTHLFKQLATALGKKLYLPGQALTKYDISGFKGPTGEYFGTVVRDALEHGGLLAIDEGDMWAAAALGFLNAPLANGWCNFPDATIEVHPDFQCLIAANTYGRGATQEYIGRNPLDAASLDRFSYITVDYDPILERQLYGSGPWTEYVQRVREAVRELKLQHVISMRATLRVHRGIAAGLSIDEILQTALWRGLSPDTITKITRLSGDPPRITTDDSATESYLQMAAK